MSQTASLTWMWNKKPVLLEDLDERQLHTVKKSIENSSNKVWFGNHSDKLLTEINSIINYNTQVINELKRMRIKKTIKTADVIVSDVIKWYK
jgi:hypothetical protein